MTRFDHDFESCARTYVTLCIYHDDLTPEKMTGYLGVDPDRTVEKGQELSLSVAPRNGWFWGTRERYNSKDVGFHTQVVLDILSIKNQRLIDLKSLGCEIRLMCFWESSAGNGGPILDHKILMALSKIPLDLHFDIWID